jgi:CO/xanthine dehydrogenase Mo-binding subunit
MALLEETESDRTGRLATTSLAEYVVAVNADYAMWTWCSWANLTR